MFKITSLDNVLLPAASIAYYKCSTFQFCPKFFQNEINGTDRFNWENFKVERFAELWRCCMVWSSLVTHVILATA